MKALHDLIRRFEGCKLQAYKCPGGVWTCGYGSTGPDVGPKTAWTQAQAEARMKDDAEKFLHGVLKISPVLKDHPNRLAAVADFAYNVGLGAYQKSTLRRKIEAQEWDACEAEFMKWTLAGGKRLPGLVARRKAEVEVFQKAV